MMVGGIYVVCFLCVIVVGCSKVLVMLCLVSSRLNVGMLLFCLIRVGCFLVCVSRCV